MNQSANIPGIDWSAERMLPKFQTPQHLTIYDIRHASPAGQLSIATLVGLINRPQPQVYLLFTDDDEFWLKELAASIPQQMAPASNDDALEGLLSEYRSSTKGMIIYDPGCIDSINVATTMAGQQDAIVVSPEQAQALQEPHKLPVLADLREHHWGSRLQAYDWALHNLLNGASSRVVAGLNPDLDPRNPFGLRTFVVATRAFVYYLDSRHFLPNLTDGLQSERGLMEHILKSYGPDTVHLGWFIDESSGVTLTSNAAIPVLATDAFTNLEIWTSIAPEAAASTAPASPAATEPAVDANKVYLSFTVSDGDNLQYIQHRMLRLWRDPARGSFPLGWTFSPALSQAAPAMAAYYLHSATPNDELVAGPSGAGYMFPSRWPSEQLPPFLQRTGQLMKDLGMTAIQVLDVDLLHGLGIPIISDLLQTGMAFRDESLQQLFAQTLTGFGLGGILSGSGMATPQWNIHNQNIPVYQNLGLASHASQAVGMVKGAAAKIQERPLFLNLYILAWSMTPSDIKQVIQQLGSGYELVKPSTLLSMLAKAKA